MLASFTQRSLGELPISFQGDSFPGGSFLVYPRLSWTSSHGRRRSGPSNLQTRHRRRAGLRECGHICLPALAPALSAPTGLLFPELPSPRQNLLPQRSPPEHPQHFRCRSLKAVSNPELIIYPIRPLTALKFTVTPLLRAQSPSLPSAVPFGREFAFCPELKT